MGIEDPFHMFFYPKRGVWWVRMHKGAEIDDKNTVKVVAAGSIRSSRLMRPQLGGRPIQVIALVMCRALLF